MQDLSKSPKSVKKLLPKRKPERKQSEEEFALRKSMFKIFPFSHLFVLKPLRCVFLNHESVMQELTTWPIHSLNKGGAAYHQSNLRMLPAVAAVS